MRIAIDGRPLIWPASGVARYTAQLIEALAEIDSQNSYYLLAQRPIENLPGPNFVAAPIAVRPWLQLAVPWQLARLDIDLFHGTNFMAPIMSAAPSVITIHDLSLLLFPQWHTWRNRVLTGLQMRLSVQRAARIIADSEHTRRDLNGLLGIPAERIEVIYLGVNETFQPLQDQAALETVRHKYGLPADVILYVGTLEPRKGLDTLIAAYGGLAADVPHDLVIAGKRGWYTEGLFRQVEALGLGRRVHFTDYIADEDLPGLYNLAHLFVYPSRYEGFGLPALEAMACGLPVVCTNAASLPEVVGDAALFVPPNDVEALAAAVRRVLDDGVLRAEMRARGLKRASRFTWEETARRTAQVYEEMR